MGLTHFNRDTNQYEIEVRLEDPFYLRTVGEERLNNGVIVCQARNFVSGFFIDALAEYENTGLTPSEIKNLQGVTVSNLLSSIKMLEKSNDELSISYNKLLQENHKLKCLLRDYLIETTWIKTYKTNILRGEIDGQV